ncbi:MAG: response regulator, partial [Spirochaetes bacterium]|nr:response regulator [Spirochaetota bacterium]
ASTAFDASVILKSENIDLVISEVDLPGDNSFELYFYIKKNYPVIPVIMVTSEPLDNFFDKIFSEGIGNVLQKPVSGNEILSLSDKLTSKTNIFGIKNYLPEIKSVKRLKITKSSQIKATVSKIIEIIEEWGFNISEKEILNLILNEIIINAVYHGHGFSEEKLKRIPVDLPENSIVQADVFYNNDSYAISITDYNGILTKDTILKSMYNVILERKTIENAVISGKDITSHMSESGRGIDLVRQLAAEYYFILDRNRRTEIILIFNTGGNNAVSGMNSLKIIEN